MTPERLSEIIAATDGGIRPPEGEPAPRKPTLAEVHAMAASLSRIAAILRPLEALEAAATDAPWGYWPGYGISPEPGVTLSLEGDCDDTDPPDDTACIIAARNALPALLREIKETP